MGIIDRRLKRLEARSASSLREHEDSVSREVLRRMTDGELDAYRAALERCVRGEEATSEDLTIATRAKTIREEVKHGFGA